MPSRKASGFQRVLMADHCSAVANFCQRVLLQQALCGMVAIATPLSLGADLGDGSYLGLAKFSPKHFEAFA